MLPFCCSPVRYHRRSAVLVVGLSAALCLLASLRSLIHTEISIALPCKYPRVLADDVRHVLENSTPREYGPQKVNCTTLSTQADGRSERLLDSCPVRRALHGKQFVVIGTPAPACSRSVGCLTLPSQRMQEILWDDNYGMCCA